jgi:hypothetical protein
MGNNFLQFLCELSAAWQWTVNCRKGLFSIDKPRSNPLSVSEDKVEEPYSPNVSPHELWIQFLFQRFEVVKYSNSDKVSFIVIIIKSSKYLLNYRQHIATSAHYIQNDFHMPIGFFQKCL